MFTYAKKSQSLKLNQTGVLRQRRAGILLPLASLLSRESFECGDLATLRNLIPFCKKTGFSILQILPLNDTGIGKSPYSSISSIAVDPIYISLADLGLSIRSRKEKILSSKINHTRIRDLKMQVLRDHFKKEMAKNEKEALDFASQFEWLESYASFRTWFSKYNGLPWWEWKEDAKNSKTGIELAKKEDWESYIFFIYLQKIAYDQLSSTKILLEKEGIFLKGDMPILTSKNSSDVWAYGEYFRTDLQAGAPPDVFSEEGQNWGFPVLDWEKIVKSDYKWWRDRLEYLQNFFHLYRIDHVIGMFRIWAIPQNHTSAKFGWFHPQTGVSRETFSEAQFSPEELIQLGLISEMSKDKFIFHWDFWKLQSYQSMSEEKKSQLWNFSNMDLAKDEDHWKISGEKALQALESFSKMLPCAEDLGAVPGFIRDSLKERRMIGIDVNRWTRSLENGSYIPKEGYREDAISVLSTHDTSLAMDWWTSQSHGEKEYAKSFFFPKNSPANASEILKGLLSFSFGTASLFSIQILQDILYCGKYEIREDWDQHRTNVPGTPEEGNWDYRSSFYAEDLGEDEEICQGLHLILKETQRIPSLT